MNKRTAKKIAEKVTNEQILEMFNKAKNNITDWNKVSNVNKGLTKGAAWNILAKDFDVNKEYLTIAKTNMIWEFGDFIDESLLPKKEIKEVDNKPPYHEDPIF